MTERQRQFHYFRMYDYDKNYRLDGLEIIKAITHTLHDETDPDAHHDDPGNFNYYDKDSRISLGVYKYE